jgi:photosystem II stability/assembly factor-like uncharacterized protein
MRRTEVWLVALLLLVQVSATQGQSDPYGRLENGERRGLQFRLIGPAAGGRVCRVAGVPGDPRIYYAATAASGLWKSTDGGFTWKPIFDDQPTSACGSLAVSPSHPHILYVGTGEANIRNNAQIGEGIFVSEDGGQTWRHAWKARAVIGTIAVHPSNPDIAFAAVLGSPYGPDEHRGVYRTRDRGRTWERVLFKNADTGASDVCIDPNNPSVIFAGLWQARRRPWELTSGGPGSGLYVSRDGGDTWQEIVGHGLPEKPYGKIGVAVAPSDSRRVYAIIEAVEGGLFRSDDGGKTWKRMSDQRGIRQRAWYYSTITVDPTNPDIVWCPNVAMMRSTDGGKTFHAVRGFHHGDHHDLWIDPKDPKRMIDGNDGGVDITLNGGESWYAPPLPWCQFYRINVDNRTPYWVSGTIQDIGALAGPSNSLNRRGISHYEWYPIGGGEAGYTAHHPRDPNIIYAGEYAGIITRFDYRNRQAPHIGIYPYRTSGEAAELRYRFRWPAPILISPHDPNLVYHAGNVLFASRDGGVTWTALSGDLTRNDKSKQGWSGGPITGDNTSAEHYCTISAIAESPVQKGVLWVGSDDGLLHLSRDGGKTWMNLTSRLPTFPEWATIKCIEASPHDAGIAYVVVDAHLLNDFRPYLFKTSDFGQSWEVLSSSLPQDEYLHVVREDPKQKGLLFLGSEKGLWFSRDAGKTWTRLRRNLPTVAVHDLVVKNDDLVVGTNGRSIYILDDLTPLRLPESSWRTEKPTLLPPRPAIRWRYHSAEVGPGAGENPPPGALLYYWLPVKPKGEVRLQIYDASHQLVKTLTSTPPPQEPREPGEYSDPAPKKAPLIAEPGLQRVVWDLTAEGARKIPGAVHEGANPETGPMVLPGKYRLVLEVDGQRSEQTLEVLPDPRLQLAESVYRERWQFTRLVQQRIGEVAELVEHIRLVREQLQRRNHWLGDNPTYADLRKRSQGLAEKLDALEGQLHNPKARISYDLLAERGGARLYSKLLVLYDVCLDADGPVTQGMREVLRDHEAELENYRNQWQKLLADELAPLNDLARKLEVPAIWLPPKNPAR